MSKLPLALTQACSRMVRMRAELALMRAGGMSNREVLASATSYAAEVLGLENEIGRLADGYSADIIAVDGNPLDQCDSSGKCRLRNGARPRY